MADRIYETSIALVAYSTFFRKRFLLSDSPLWLSNYYKTLMASNLIMGLFDRQLCILLSRLIQYGQQLVNALDNRSVRENLIAQFHTILLLKCFHSYSLLTHPNRLDTFY